MCLLSWTILVIYLNPGKFWKNNKCHVSSRNKCLQMLKTWLFLFFLNLNTRQGKYFIIVNDSKTVFITLTLLM